MAVELNFSAFDRQCNWTLCADDAPMKLTDVVPAGWALADGLAELARESDEQVSCQKGCSACCSYLASLSVPETLRLIDDIQSLPPDKQEDVRRRFGANADGVIAAWPPEQFDAADQSRTFESFGQWYSRLDMTCALLDDDACSLYDMRPIVCREHLVSFDRRRCDDARVAGESISMPFSPAVAISALAADLENTEIEAVMMPLTYVWAADNSQRADRSFPAELVLDRFAHVIHSQCIENIIATVPTALAG